MRYIIKGNKVMGTIESGQPDLDDLKSRGEIVIEQEEVVYLPAKYEDGKVIPIIEEIREEDKQEILIRQKMREIAITELKKEGKL